MDVPLNWNFLQCVIVALKSLFKQQLERQSEITIGRTKRWFLRDAQNDVNISSYDVSQVC